MNWREYLYRKLTNDDQMVAMVPADCVWGAGAVSAIPEIKPFIVVRMGPDSTTRPGRILSVQIWAHDEPGDYGRIDAVLARARDILNDDIPDEPGSHTVRWTGDSQDLADDGYGTITKYSSYNLIGSLA